MKLPRLDSRSGSYADSMKEIVPFKTAQDSTL